MTVEDASMREPLLRAALRHVPFDGWSARALRAGAEDIGRPPAEAVIAFPGGALEMIELHHRLADRDMATAISEADTEGERIRDRIARAVRIRLEACAEDREAIRRAVVILALPTNAPMATRMLYDTVDAIWRGAGDTATDWNFYTKRGLLAAVYSATVLYWLQDESAGYEETWRFLDRRIADAMRVPKFVEALGSRINPLCSGRRYGS